MGILGLGRDENDRNLGLEQEVETMRMYLLAMLRERLAALRGDNPAPQEAPSQAADLGSDETDEIFGDL